MLTIFTPTYNRKELLTVAYKKLCAQTEKRFIWMIVDDGSTDETAQIVEDWKRESILQILYYYKKNGGKMRAYNYGVTKCTTELFICVDSDDYMQEDAVETIYKTWENAKKESIFPSLAGIVAYYKCINDTKFHASRIFPNVRYSTLRNLYKLGYSGETALVFRSDILKQHLFPEISGETFIPESVIYDQIDNLYQLLVLPHVLTTGSYQDNGLTNSIKALRRNNPRGWLLHYQIKISSTPCSVLRYKYIAHAICFSWQIKESIFRQIPAAKIEILFCIPGAVILKLMRKL